MRSTLLLGIALLSSLAACAADKNSAKLETPAATAAPDAQAAWAFKIGALDAFALKDGDITMANDQKTFAVGQPKPAVDALLAAANLPTDQLHVSIQPLLVRDGQKTYLFDTGAGSASFAVAGKLQASLAAAGVKPEGVTDIFLSHGDPDHVGGLVRNDGALAFPNAVIHVSAPEWEAIKTNGELPNLVAAITPKVVTFAPNSAIFPSVTAVAVRGHTPGHSAYDIASGGEHLLFLGDSAHHSVISVQRPDWTVAFDQAEPEARASRRALLQRAANENLHVYGGHFPYPGLGHVKAQGEGFVWVPDQPTN